MPVNTSFQEQYYSKIQVLFNEKIALSPVTLKERVMLAHHRELLDALIHFFDNNSASPLLLKEILANNWHKYKKTICSYTAQPESDVTLLLCDIANTLGQKTGEKPIDLLMPGVSTESIVDSMPSLDEMDLKAVLKTHILSESGNYLYSVAALGSLACESDTSFQQIPNPYYDYNQGPENEAYIPAAALERMLNHSTHTQAILDAKAHFQSLIKPTNLLGQLQLLIKTLRMNSTAGIGSEEQAGTRAYVGIISFNEYYQTLNEEQKHAIPQEVKHEIDLLLSLLSSKKQNDEGTQNLQTCANTRQSSLVLATKKHEQTLINIGVDEKTQSEMIKQARASFELSQKQLIAQCSQDTYQGKDKLTLSKELIEVLSVHIAITTEADLQDFISLGAADIESLLENNEELQDQLVQKLDNLEALIIFTSIAPIEQMEKVLHFTANKLPKPTAVEFSVWLEMLDLKRFKIVFNTFKESDITSVASFEEILKHLSVEKRVMIYNEYKNKLPSLIQSARDVGTVLRCLNVENAPAMFEAFKDKFLTLIKSAKDINAVFMYLNVEQCAMVYEVIKDRIPSLIQSPTDVNAVFRYLNVEQRAMAYETIKGRLPGLIQTSDDVCKVFAFLTIENRAAVFEAIKERLPSLIKSAKDANVVFMSLEGEQRAMVFEAIKDRLPNLIHIANDVSLMLKNLSIDQFTVALDAVKNKFPTLILSTFQVYLAIDGLSFIQCEAILETMKDQLPSLIQTANDVQSALQYLGVEQRAAVFEAIKDKISSLIQSAVELSEALRFLTIEQRAIVFEAIKDKIPSLIQSARDLGAMFFVLNVEHQLEVVFDAIKNKLPSLIQTADDVSKVLRHLNYDARLAVLKAIKDRLPLVIQRTSDVCNLFGNLKDEQRDVFFEAIKYQLPSLIQDAFDIGIVFNYLKIEQCEAVLEAMKDQLPKLFQTADVDNIYFSEEKRAVVLAALKKAQDKLADNPPTFLPHKRINEGNEQPAKRQKRVGRREMDFLHQNGALDQPRERNRPENNAKRQRIRLGD